MSFHRPTALAVSLLLATAPLAGAQGADPSLIAGLHWRMIGPFRGGRTVAATGVPGHRGLFYIGVNDGGVWRSHDAGRTWTPIFDDAPTGSVGALAVAPSNPSVIYVGSGEGLQRPDLSIGDGVYRSTNAGRTWTCTGLRDGQQIPAIAVDPRDPNRVFAAVLGHPYGANHERGVFRSLDGGASWKNVLYRDENTGAMDVVLDPSDPRTVYAVLWASRQSPWEGNESWTLSAANGLFKSTDGGESWKAIGAGLPGAAAGLGRIGLGVCPSDPRRLYAVVGATTGRGLYRSDDGGEHWRLQNADPRLCGRDGDFNEVKADPRDANVVYIANVVSWKSVDGGRTFEALRGAPGGDDYHRFWIDPDDSNVILLAGDQGAVVTLNGGRTWSSWYNQPTAQFYHVSTDDEFPYHVYGAQQESGSACVSSRGDDGAITLREWHPVGIEEYGYVVPDPLHPGVVYGGKLERFDRATGDVQEVSPDPLRRGDHRWVRTMPVAFSPADPTTLYLGSNVLFRSRDGARTWAEVSPDLTRDSSATPASVGVFATLDSEHGHHRGVIYALAPSPLRAGLIWAGTDDGRIHVTHDGGRAWRDVTPPSLTPWSKVSVLEASHTDSLEAWAAINRFRLDDLAPHVLRTRDGGRTWTEIVSGIGRSEVVNAVREDPVRPRLLYAGTERGVWTSLDDGEHWQSLRLDMPATSVRDLTIHGADLVVATHGRSFWILDDVTPLRQADVAGQNLAAHGAHLFHPERATRVRWSRNTDTPMPPDEPAAANPPEGAVLDFALARDATGPVTLEVLDAAGRAVRRYTSEDRAAPPDSGEVPAYWVRPFRALPATRGAHRFLWDLHGEPPAVRTHGYPMAAIAHETVAGPLGPWAPPGTYIVRLRANGLTLEQRLEVRMDPRVKTSREGLERQFALATRLTSALARDTALVSRAVGLRFRLAAAGEAAAGARRDSLAAVAGEVRQLLGAPPAGRQGGSGPARREDGAYAMNGLLARLYDIVEDSDLPPTTTVESATAALERTLGELESRLRALESRASR